jgi:hypothetical protein
MGFLHHLAGLALGATPAGAARPSLPSRFAPSPFAGPSQGLQVIEQATPTVPVVRSPQPRAMPPASFERRETASPAAPRLQQPPPPAEPHAVASRPVRQEMGPPPPPPTPSIVTVVERRSSPEKPSAVIGESPERSHPVPAAQRQPESPHTDVDIRVIPEAQVTRAAPLSSAVVAGRAMAAREQPPVIHVTIDRLEVRAPARAEPARQRPRPQPTVSLSDYLRDGFSGGRR